MTAYNPSARSEKGGIAQPAVVGLWSSLKNNIENTSLNYLKECTEKASLTSFRSFVT